MNENMQILATDALIAWEELEELAETILLNLYLDKTGHVWLDYKEEKNSVTIMSGTWRNIFMKH
jgi:hypothetical protein